MTFQALSPASKKGPLRDPLPDLRGGGRLASGARYRLGNLRGVLRRAQPNGAWLLDEGRAWQVERAGELEEQTQRGEASAGSQVLQFGWTDAGGCRQAL